LAPHSARSQVLGLPFSHGRVASTPLSEQFTEPVAIVSGYCYWPSVDRRVVLFVKRMLSLFPGAFSARWECFEPLKSYHNMTIDKMKLFQMKG